VAKKNNYTAKDIEILEGLDPVRKRPGMYIGNTFEEGLHHLVNEVLDNSIDEVLAGYAKNISITFSKNNLITIKDDGRGIPTDFHPKFKKKRAFEVVLTTLHSGGKFNDKAYKISGGLHGVGISVVNALSEMFQIKIYNKSKIYSQNYIKGKPKNKVVIKKCNKNLKGTEITFKPDESIFGEIQFSPETLFDFVKMKAVLVKSTKINWNADKDLVKTKIPHQTEFFYPKGIEDYIKEISKSKILSINKNFNTEIKFDNNEKCEIFINFNEEEISSLNSFCNTIKTPDGGSHENALKNASVKAIKIFGQKNKYNKIVNINVNDLFDFSDSIISIFLNDPSFEGQTKKRISMPSLQKKLEAEIVNKFLSWLNTNKKESVKLIEKLIERSLLRTDLFKIKEMERKTTNRVPLAVL